jgi:aldehyde reductase
MASVAEKVPVIRLNDGNFIPVIGLGTFESPPGVVENVVKVAIDAGYRHFDCADFYENEDEVGKALRQAIKDGKVKREDLFITSKYLLKVEKRIIRSYYVLLGKVWPNWFAKGRPTKSAQRTLKNLGFDYVDLLLIHWPTPLKQVDDDFYPQDKNGQCLFDESIQLIDVWKEFEDIKKRGIYSFH